MNASTKFVVLNRCSDELLYEADCLCQAQGYVDAAEESTVLAAVVQKRWGLHEQYQICVVDDESGQIVARGPIVNVSEAADLLCSLSLVLLPAMEGGAA